VNREEIMNILPHRDDMLLVEEAYLEDGAAHGRYTVRGDEFFLRGHFPGNPVVPGVILCEMLAQSACVLLAAGQSEGCTPFFTSMNNVKFKNPVRPGDTFETRCVITREKKPFYFCAGEGYVDGKLCVKAEFSFALVKND
jgi:3-hydroxyacyl-[acyl-carrier-protein] dehydratase